MSNQSSTRTPSTDIEALRKYINLPRRPVSAVWRAGVQGGEGSLDVPGPTDWYLTAVLTFSPKDMEEIVAEASRRERPRFRIAVKEIDWFPDEAKKYASKEEGADDFKLEGQLYDPSAFVKPPLMGGYLLRIGETTHLFVNLFTT